MKVVTFSLRPLDARHRGRVVRGCRYKRAARRGRPNDLILLRAIALAPRAAAACRHGDVPRLCAEGKGDSDKGDIRNARALAADQAAPSRRPRAGIHVAERQGREGHTLRAAEGPTGSGDHVQRDETEALGAKLVALSAETADESVSTAEKNELRFEVLSGDGLSVAEKFGVMFTVPDDIKRMCTGFGVDLDNRSGNEGERKARLPAPATYVIDKKGVVQYVLADLDYTKRAERSEVMEVLGKLAAGAAVRRVGWRPQKLCTLSKRVTWTARSILAYILAALVRITVMQLSREGTKVAR
ncbi:alkyl hydroperoxide reductase [Gracilaria domingensis]|nr:alkyl hydroperoxide reductase [Gracilaria domingensis]